MKELRYFTCVTVDDATWSVVAEDHRPRLDVRFFGLRREIEGRPEEEEEVTQVKDPNYVELFKEINDQPSGSFSFRIFKLTQAEWAWLRGVIHSLMCECPNPVPVEATLIGTSRAM
jgi:hypothetical protein